VGGGEHAFRALVTGVNVSKGRVDDAVTVHLREPVVYWVLERDVVDRFAHETTGIRVRDEITNSLSHLKSGIALRVGGSDCLVVVAVIVKRGSGGGEVATRSFTNPATEPSVRFMVLQLWMGQ